MYPDILSIGPFTLHTYGLFVAAGFLAGLGIVLRLAPGAGIASRHITDMGFLILLAAVIGSRVMYILMNLSLYRRAPLDILKIWQGGLVFSGGIIAVVLTAGWYLHRHRLPFWKICDLWSPAAAVAQSIGRIGCFMAGCCYGAPTSRPWAVVFSDPHCLAPTGVPLHPTQLYSSLSGLVIFVVTLVLFRRRTFDGQVFLWFMILHSTARLLMERFRGDARGIITASGMTVTQAVTLGILALAVVTLMVMKKKRSRHP